MITIYLAGDLPKGDEEARGFVNWRERYQTVLSEVFSEAQFIDPFRITKNENDLYRISHGIYFNLKS